MATTDYSNVATATIENKGAKDVTIQMYRVNLFETIKAGDTLVLGIEEAEEAIYYKSLENGTPVDVYTLLAEEPADWSTAYASYFVKDEDGNFVPNDDSTWASDTFYSKSVVMKDQTIAVTIA